MSSTISSVLHLRNRLVKSELHLGLCLGPCSDAQQHHMKKHTADAEGSGKKSQTSVARLNATSPCRALRWPTEYVLRYILYPTLLCNMNAVYLAEL